MQILSGFIIIVVSYLIGAIPTAYLAGKFFKGIDIRQYGSGNIGATNAFRIIGKPVGIGVLIFDILKGFIPIILATRLAPQTYTQLYQVLAGFAAISGHIWTVFLNFKGGKGVATTLGVCLTLAPLATAISLIIFVLTVAATRYISVGSILMAICITLLIRVLDKNNQTLFWVSLILTLVIIIKHIPNIKRLLKHQEHKFSFKKGN